MTDVTTAALAGASLVAMLAWRVNPIWLVAGGAATGLVVTWWGWGRASFSAVVRL